jgi:WXG100 family type VII secretion target
MPDVSFGGAGKAINADDQATLRMLNAFNEAQTSIHSIVGEIGDMQTRIPSFWQGDAANAFTQSVGSWLDGAHQLQAGLNTLSGTMEDARARELNTEDTNLTAANVPTVIHY